MTPLELSFTLLYQYCSISVPLEIGKVGINMKTYNKLGVTIGIIGGLGLGLMLGSEFTGQYITIVGAIILVISIILMALFSYTGRK